MTTKTRNVPIYCERHPKLPAERKISGIPMCSECLSLETAARRESSRKGVTRRERNRALRSRAALQVYSRWEAAFRLELRKKVYRGITQIFARPEIAPHLEELCGRIFQYCTTPIASQPPAAHLRQASAKAANTLRRAAQYLRAVRDLRDVESKWQSYVLDQYALQSDMRAKAGELLRSERRTSPQTRLEPEQLEHEAHNLRALATALASATKSLARQGDGIVAPILVYLDLYLKSLLPTSKSVPVLVKLLNAGFAASALQFRLKLPTLRKRLRDYQRQHEITVYQLRLRVRVMTEGPEILGDADVHESQVPAFTYEAEHLKLPTGKFTIAPRCPALPPSPSRTK